MTVLYAGKDLIELFQSQDTGLNRPDIYKQMFDSIEEFHLRVGRPHGDIKLDNFVYCEKTSIVRLIDYQTGAHTDSCRSINHHLTFKQMPKDDFESLGYTMLHSLLGNQLWFKNKKLIAE